MFPLASDQVIAQMWSNGVRKVSVMLRSAENEHPRLEVIVHSGRKNILIGDFYFQCLIGVE